MDDKAFSQVIIFNPAEKALLATPMDHYRKLEHEYDQFKDLRAWVIRNMHHLKGERVEIEVHHITNLETLDCIIIDDLLILPYHEVAEMLMKIMEEKKSRDTRLHYYENNAREEEHK